MVVRSGHGLGNCSPVHRTPLYMLASACVPGRSFGCYVGPALILPVPFGLHARVRTASALAMLARARLGPAQRTRVRAWEASGP